MSSTPLLAAVGGLPGPFVLQDHPVFLRASHSPWTFIPQNSLTVLRGIVVAYLVAAGAMAAGYKLTELTDHSKWYLLFHFGTLSYVMTLVYHVITFSWTFTHLYYPVYQDVEGTMERWIVKAMSLPNNMGSPRKQFYFSMFHTATTVFAFMNTGLFWFVTRWHNPVGTGIDLVDGPISDILGAGWFEAFALANLYGAPAVAMAIETLFFNSIKRPQALGSHLVGLSSLCGLYLGWAALGGEVTGCFPFYWMNEDFVGSKEAVAAHCAGFVALAPMMFTLNQGIVGLREGLTTSRMRMREAIENAAGNL